MRVRHPNIALLYAYALSSHHHRGHYLLYELAEKGSLDLFWNSDLGRERLSSFGLRTQIAMDTLIGLQFLHVGNSRVKPSFHGDIKSANIVLKRDFTAQLIDCGMGAFTIAASQRDDSSSGVCGTLGYICPKFCTGMISYRASCDIFSFGVVLAELWSGKLQNHRDNDGRINNFFDLYIDSDAPRNMRDDLDKSFGVNLSDIVPSYMEEFQDLAIACMSSNPSKRPAGNEILNRLGRIWQSCKQQEGTEVDDYDVQSLNESLQSISDTSSTDDSMCRVCRTYAVEVGFGECPLCLSHQQQRLAIARGVPMELNAESTAPMMDKFKVLRAGASSLYDFEHKGHDPLLSIRDLRLNHSLPRLFVLLPADDSDRSYFPSMWLDTKVPMRFHLYFICQETLEIVDPPIQVTMSRVWIRQVALLLGMSLTLLKKAHPHGVFQSCNAASDNSSVTMDQQELNEILNQVQHMLQGTSSLETLGRVKSGSNLSAQDIEVLNGPAYELIAERARQNLGWRSNIAPVRKLFGVQISWILRRVAEDPENDYEVIET